MKKNFENVIEPVALDGENGVEQVVAASPGGPQYEALELGLKNFFGDGFDINDKLSQEVLLEHLFMNREQNERLAEVLGNDPRLAQMLADMVDGKRNAHSAMARYFGSSMMNVNEGSPEFEEMMQADEERREEVLRIANDRREYEQNLEASRGVIEEFCKERGYEPAEFMDSVWEKIVMPILSGSYSHDVCVALEHAMNYDRDVEDAFAAGDIKGRNTNIQRLRQDFGDGMPKGMSSAAPDTARRRRRNSLIEDALNA